MREYRVFSSRHVSLSSSPILESVTPHVGPGTRRPGPRRGDVPYNTGGPATDVAPRRPFVPPGRRRPPSSEGHARDGVARRTAVGHVAGRPPTSRRGGPTRPGRPERPGVVPDTDASQGPLALRHGRIGQGRPRRLSGRPGPVARPYAGPVGPAVPVPRRPGRETPVAYRPHVGSTPRDGGTVAAPAPEGEGRPREKAPPFRGRPATGKRRRGGEDTPVGTAAAGREAASRDLRVAPCPRVGGPRTRAAFPPQGPQRPSHSTECPRRAKETPASSPESLLASGRAVTAVGVWPALGLSPFVSRMSIT